MNKIIVTIGRQFGSGGHNVGKFLAQSLQIPYYDRNLIEMASEKSGIEVGLLSYYDERTSASSLMKAKSGEAAARGIPVGETLFQVQSQLILEIARAGSCVIVGRCADYILRDFPELFSIFITAPVPDRLARVMDRNHMPEEDAAAALKKVDHQRAVYYNFYTGKKWGDPKSYHLTVDSSILGIEGTARLLEDKIRSHSSDHFPNTAK